MIIKLRHVQKRAEYESTENITKDGIIQVVINWLFYKWPILNRSNKVSKTSLDWSSPFTSWITACLHQLMFTVALEIKSGCLFDWLRIRTSDLQTRFINQYVSHPFSLWANLPDKVVISTRVLKQRADIASIYVPQRFGSLISSLNLRCGICFTLMKKKY